ncbi:hypothetical protein GGR54DRAFT_635591 [Hypoxylon sp. NC1633]|nr:hypothetical protein GGR54DRAFT_635591 [Hypoxylon sp. NC1633]
MSAQPLSPGSSEVAADQPKEPLLEAQPKSQDGANHTDLVRVGSPVGNAVTLESTQSPQSEDSQETGEASPTSPTKSAIADSTTPPLPNEAPPAAEDDGWDFHWDATNQAYFFHNRFTNESTWENPRLANKGAAQDTTSQAQTTTAAEPPKDERPPAGGYNPAIHGDYDPNAWYAKSGEEETLQHTQPVDPSTAYAAIGSFNRFSGKWQGDDQNPERHNDEAKSKRQMNAFFDVDAAANSHDGRSLKAERSGKKPTKAELKQFKEKRKARKEEKRRAWLRD